MNHDDEVARLRAEFDGAVGGYRDALDAIDLAAASGRPAPVGVGALRALADRITVAEKWLRDAEVERLTDQMSDER